MEIQNKNLLGTLPIGKLMLKLSLPAITAQLINILYNMVDRIFIGHIKGAESSALTGLGICLPILMIISAFSSFAGAGGAPLASIELGKAENDKSSLNKANEILNNALYMLIFFSITLTLFFYIFRTPILSAFGASETTLPYANDYLSIYLLGTVFVQISVGLNSFISAQGHAKTAMISIIIGAILNIILDPIFIFVFNMGVKGAALATIISQGFSAIWIFSFLTSKKSQLKINFKSNKLNFKICGKIAILGVAPFIMQSTESAIFIVFNSGLQKYGGDLYVGTMTILQSLMQLCLIPIQGFTYGVQPIISYNFGAKKLQRTKMVIKRMLIISVSFSVCVGLLIILNPVFFGKMFTKSQDLLNLVAKYLPIYFGAVWIFGIQMAAQTTFVALGKAKTSLFIACLRKLILFIPLALILPQYFGVQGIFYSEPIASAMSAMTSFVLFIFTYKKLHDTSDEE